MVCSAAPIFSFTSAPARTSLPEFNRALVRLTQPTRHSTVVVLPAPFSPMADRRRDLKLTPRASSTVPTRFFRFWTNFGAWTGRGSRLARG
jgi:hypothetical protein